MNIVVSYACHNRREYVELTAPHIIDICRQYGEAYLYCGDDNSKDGTWEYLNTLEGFNKLEQRKVGNSLWQINEAFKIAKEIGAKYVYGMANDIILPDGIMEEMVKIMDSGKYVSVMVAESDSLPQINAYTINESFSFTSSLGLHRVDCFPSDMVSKGRFFGFQKYQYDSMIEKDLLVGRVEGITNTNLDCSAWSRQYEYKAKGYSRTGMVANIKNVYK